MNPIAYAHDHREEALAQLIELLRIPSISTLSEHSGDMRRTAEWLRDALLQIGLTEAEVAETDGHPLVYAEWLGAPGAPTVLLYGHYDVQPPDPLNEWESAPFEPTLRDGNLYARGAADDKGQFFAHFKALEALMATAGSLPVNVKVLIEGEEEIGSANLDGWIAANRERLRADVAVISDSHILSEQQPTIVYGLRGLAYLELHVESAARDLHSGTYGGAIHNPIQALCEIVAQLHDANGTITVPGFYDGIAPLDEDERAELARIPYGEAELVAESGATQAWGEAEFSVVERTSTRPTLELNGIWGGFQGQGAKTVLPARAAAKISMRLVPGQEPERISKLLKAHLLSLAPPTVRATVNELHHGRPGLVPRDIPPMHAASEAYEEVFGARPIFVREGGSIPIVATLQSELGMPTVLMGFGLPDDGLHGPNEKMALSMFHRGIETAILFYQKLAQHGA